MKIAKACGNSLGIIGGGLAVAGAALTMTGVGAAVGVPLLISGASVGGAGSATHIGNTIANAVISKQQREKVNKAVRDMDEKEKKFSSKLSELKEMLRRLELRCVDSYHLQTILTDVLGIEHAQQIIRDSSKACSENMKAENTDMLCNISTKAAVAGVGLGVGSKIIFDSVDDVGAATAKIIFGNADDIGEAGARGLLLSSKVFGGVMIGINAVFIIWDGVELGKTIHDLVKEKGSAAAAEIRKFANDLESVTVPGINIDQEQPPPSYDDVSKEDLEEDFDSVCDHFDSGELAM